MTKYGSLKWSDAEAEGSVTFTKEFEAEHEVFKLDALKDWIFDLQTEYERILASFIEPKGRNK